MSAITAFTTRHLSTSNPVCKSSELKALCETTSVGSPSFAEIYASVHNVFASWPVRVWPLRGPDIKKQKAFIPGNRLRRFMRKPTITPFSTRDQRKRNANRLDTPMESQDQL